MCSFRKKHVKMQSWRNEIHLRGWVRAVVFHATFNNISFISLWSVLLVEEARENHWHAAKLLLRPPAWVTGHLPEWPFKKLKKLWLWYLLRSGFIHFLLKSGRHKKMYTNQIKMFVSFPYFYWNALMGNTLTALH